jgi:uncharacterized membrane protein
MGIIWALIGLVLGGALSKSIFGSVVGLAFGIGWARMSGLRRDLDAARLQLAAIGQKLPLAAPQARAADQVAAAPVPSESPPAMPESSPLETPAPAIFVAPPPAAPKPPARPITPPSPGLFELAVQRIKLWFTEGNLPVKIGILVLFAGIAALLKYASDAGMLHTPPALRVSVVALAAMAALAFGWRQRHTRRTFGLSLQGGAIGVLLMTIFAAFRLYQLLPATAAFALLIVLVAGIGVLAVLQEALALAVFGLLAGFAAPILISTGSGNHVALFTYYAVLNVAILGIAWVRSWRILNLLGFVATFGIGTAWGVLSYKPELFASTEPFVILNFAFYLLIPLLHLMRAPPQRRSLIEGSLLFGNPLVSLLLQGALLKWHGPALAISALVVAVIYLAVAWSIRHKPALALLRDAWAVLAVAFATLAVPLALTASLTASIFALEGAGLIWLGLRQQRILPRWSGLALQLFAAVSLAFSWSSYLHRSEPILFDSDFIGALLIVGAAFVSTWLYNRFGSGTIKQRLIAVVLYAWGLCWWLGAMTADALPRLPLQSRSAGLLALLAFTAWLAAEAARRRPRYALANATAITVPVLLVATLALIGACLDSHTQPLAGWMLVAIVAYAVFAWRALVCIRTYPMIAVIAQLAWLWQWLLTFAVAIVLALEGGRWMADAWRELLALAPALLLCSVALIRPRSIAPPLGEHIDRLRPWLLFSLLALMSIVFVTGLGMDGDAAPLRFIPLLNPLELLLLAIMAMAARWFADAETPAELQRLRPIVLGIAAMVFATSATLRAVHQLGGVPWDDHMGSSSLAQMSLTVVWSVLGVLAWVWGSRRGQRMLWLAGAVTMGIVLLKLLLIDRGHLGNLFGIASFIAYGLLCTVIGYFAPAPPKHAQPSPSEVADAP